MKYPGGKLLGFDDVKQKYRRVCGMLTVVFFVAFGFATTTHSAKDSRPSVFPPTNYGFGRSKRHLHSLSFADVQPLRNFFLPQKSLRGQLHFGQSLPTLLPADQCAQYDANHDRFSDNAVFTVLSWFPFCPYLVLSLFLVSHLVLVFAKPAYLLSQKTKVLRAFFHGAFALGSLEILVLMAIEISVERSGVVPRWQFVIASALTLLFFVMQTVLVVASYFIDLDEENLSIERASQQFKRPFNLFFYVAALSLLCSAFVISSIHEPGGILRGLSGESNHAIVWIYPENSTWRSTISFVLATVISSTVWFMVTCLFKSHDFYINHSALFLHFVNSVLLFMACCIDGYYYFVASHPYKHCKSAKPLRSAIFDSFAILSICCGLYFFGSCALACDFFGRSKPTPKRKSAVVTRF